MTDLFFNRIQSLLILNQVGSAATVLEEYRKIFNQADGLALFIQFKFIRHLFGLS